MSEIDKEALDAAYAAWKKPRMHVSHTKSDEVHGLSVAILAYESSLSEKGGFWVEVRWEETTAYIGDFPIGYISQPDEESELFYYRGILGAIGKHWQSKPAAMAAVEKAARERLQKKEQNNG